MARLRARSPQNRGARCASSPAFSQQPLTTYQTTFWEIALAPNLSGPRAFHVAVLDQGPLPLDVLEGKIDVWIKERK